ncbi:MAG TPA: alpha/beta family hydrolase [Acetobacteraceae bacterium]|nr:alpha/beta family hydrolase [Acetobacteraceae bacterium]
MNVTVRIPGKRAERRAAAGSGGKRAAARACGEGNSPGMQVCFLAGDRYPLDRPIEDALRARLDAELSGWLGQDEILRRCGGRLPMCVEDRVAALRAVLATEATGGLILIGRSSGARVATAFAARHGARAVICLGYPFRNPDHVIQPERFVDLATLAVPTLIVQGTDDPYGGADITENYALSPAVSVRFIRADHELDLSPAQWDDIAATVRAFLQHAAAGVRFQPHRFDEAFYLACYPDVAEAVAAGRLASGEQHYRIYGQAERRRFRYVVE